MWSLIPTWFQSNPKNHFFVVWHLVVQFQGDQFLLTDLFVPTHKCFFNGPQFQYDSITTLIINHRLNLVVWHLIERFHKDPYTYTYCLKTKRSRHQHYHYTTPKSAAVQSFPLNGFWEKSIPSWRSFYGLHQNLMKEETNIKTLFRKWLIDVRRTSRIHCLQNWTINVCRYLIGFTIY